MSGLDVLSGGLVIAGAGLIVIGLIGVYRLPDFFTRLHAACVIDTLGALLILTGLLIPAGLTLTGVKLILILALILVTTPTAAHAIAKSALHGGQTPRLDGETR